MEGLHHPQRRGGRTEPPRLLQPDRSFHAIVRFSNSSETLDPDGTPTALGMATKLLDSELDSVSATPDSLHQKHKSRPQGGSCAMENLAVALTTE